MRASGRQVRYAYIYVLNDANTKEGISRMLSSSSRGKAHRDPMLLRVDPRLLMSGRPGRCQSGLQLQSQAMLPVDKFKI